MLSPELQREGKRDSPSFKEEKSETLRLAAPWFKILIDICYSETTRERGGETAPMGLWLSKP